MGRLIGSVLVRDYMFLKKVEFFEKVIEVLKELMREYDFVIIEGVGFFVEINLKDYDIVNMCVVKVVNVFVILVVDIDRGGSFV